MWSSRKSCSGTQPGQWVRRDIPKFDTVRLTSPKLEQLTTKIFKPNSNSHKRVELWTKGIKISWISDAISPARHPQKSSQHVRACAAGDDAICSKNRKIVPCHGANPNTRNGARLQSPSPIMAPDDSRDDSREISIVSSFRKYRSKVLKCFSVLETVNHQFSCQRPKMGENCAFLFTRKDQRDDIYQYTLGSS